jgi:hypothetical protein
MVSLRKLYPIATKKTEANHTCKSSSIFTNREEIWKLQTKNTNISRADRIKEVQQERFQSIGLTRQRQPNQPGQFASDERVEQAWFLQNLQAYYHHRVLEYLPAQSNPA